MDFFYVLFDFFSKSAHIGGLEIKGGSKGASAVWCNIRVIVNFWMALPKSKQPKENKIYIYLKAAITDSLMLVKFNFLPTLQKF